MRVYCAGPLFNQGEQQEMLEISKALEGAGHSTFLPQRDGLEFATLHLQLKALGYDADHTASLLMRAIFALDVCKLTNECDAVIANLNGRVPDEGTVVEAALAWSFGKPLVLFKADGRSMLDGKDNPMLVGLSSFQVTSEIAQIPIALEEAVRNQSNEPRDRAIRLGAEISTLLKKSPTKQQLALELTQFITTH